MTDENRIEPGDGLVERLLDRGVLPLPCKMHDLAMRDAATEILALRKRVEMLEGLLTHTADALEIALEPWRGAAKARGAECLKVARKALGADR